MTGKCRSKNKSSIADRDSIIFEDPKNRKSGIHIQHFSIDSRSAIQDRRCPGPHCAHRGVSQEASGHCEALPSHRFMDILHHLWAPFCRSRGSGQ